MKEHIYRICRNYLKRYGIQTDDVSQVLIELGRNPDIVTSLYEDTGILCGVLKKQDGNCWEHMSQFMSEGGQEHAIYHLENVRGDFVTLDFYANGVNIDDSIDKAFLSYRHSSSINKEKFKEAYKKIRKELIKGGKLNKSFGSYKPGVQARDRFFDLCNLYIFNSLDCDIVL